MQWLQKNPNSQNHPPTIKHFESVGRKNYQFYFSRNYVYTEKQMNNMSFYDCVTVKICSELFFWFGEPAARLYRLLIWH